MVAVAISQHDDIARAIDSAVGRLALEPLGGKPVETGLVIASTDPLAADAIGAPDLRARVSRAQPRL